MMLVPVLVLVLAARGVAVAVSAVDADGWTLRNVTLRYVT